MPVTHHVEAPDTELAQALELGLAAPLRAVETALARLAGDLNGAVESRLEAPRAALTAALREAEATVELFAQRPLRQDRCTVRELACSARAALPAALRERVWVATEPGGAPVEIDAPTFSRALSALLLRAARASSHEILLHGHQDEGETTFAVVDDLDAHGDVLATESRSPLTPELLLAQADLNRLGALVVEHPAGPHRCTTIRISQGGAR